jgi:hypothetical protein
MTIKQARQFLKEQGFFTDNLWCIDDVKLIFKCTDEQAQEVLEHSLTNEATIEQINFSIYEFGDMFGLTRLTDEA